MLRNVTLVGSSQSELNFIHYSMAMFHSAFADIKVGGLHGGGRSARA